MNTSLLLQSISKHVQLTEQEQHLLVEASQNRHIKKKQMLVQEGSVHHFTSFVLSGCLRLYAIDKNGYEHILQFAPSGWWMGDIRSLLSGEPGVLNIDALEDTEIVTIEKSAMDELYKTIPSLERFFRILAENSLATYQHRLIDNLSLSAAERYKNFCKRYPTLIEQLPQKQIAAYIGVTPEFMSKMLSQLQQKKQ